MQETTAIEVSRPTKPVPLWTAEVPGEGVLVRLPGWTKSEARAAAKKRLSLRRLPPGTILTRNEPDDNEPASAA